MKLSIVHFATVIAGIPGKSVLENDCVNTMFPKENFRLKLVVEDSKYVLVASVGRTFPVNAFDLILTSETIYNPEDYEALHDAFVLCTFIKRWVAAKVFYFGVGGDIPTFTDFVEKKGVFKIETKQSISADIPRVILELRR
ncbi:hypothetical protein OSTOST_03221 [Ostertagia ostertagi]